jgi:hypothetical protein
MRSKENGPAGVAAPRDPAHRERTLTVDTNILRNTAAEVPAPTSEETPHGCMDGWVFLGFEAEDESGEHVEVIERVPCRRCRPESL